MKKSELRKLIREELSALNKTSLEVGEIYQIHEPGMDEWYDNNEYLGFDKNSGDYIFRAPEAPGSFIFTMIPEEDIENSVR